jgi:hypothetical protein
MNISSATESLCLGPDFPSFGAKFVPLVLLSTLFHVRRMYGGGGGVMVFEQSLFLL